MPKSHKTPKTHTTVGRIEQLTQNTPNLSAFAPVAQEVHFLGLRSMDYEHGLNRLLNSNKRIICLTRTNEHLIVITEG